MSNSIRITESQFKRLFTTNINEINNKGSIFNKLSKCIISEDRNYVSYLGRNYDTKTGEELVISEQGLAAAKSLGTAGKVAASDDGWSFSDIAHTVVDIASAGVDFIYPGAGAAIDAVHALSYIVEAQFESDPEKRDTLYFLALITGAFAAIPFAFQAYAPVIKRMVKTGQVPAKQTGVLGKIFKSLKDSIPTIIKWFRDKVEWVLNTSLGKKLITKNSDEILKSIDDFARNISNVLTKKTSNARKWVSKQRDILSRKVVSDPKLLKLAKSGKMDKLVKQNKFWDGDKIIKLADEKTGELSSDVIKALKDKPDLAKKYLDDLVFDVSTGKGYSISSEFGQKVIEKNIKTLSGKAKNYKFGKRGTSEFYSIPKEFQKNIRGMLPKDKTGSFKAASSWSKKQVVRKSVANTFVNNFESSRNIIGKYIIGNKSLSGNEKIFLKALHNVTPLGSIKNAKKSFLSIFQKEISKGARGMRFLKSVGNVIIINEYVTFINRQLCLSGIRNKYSEDSFRFLLLGLDEMVKSPDVYKDDLPGGDTLDNMVKFFTGITSIVDWGLSFVLLRDCSTKGMFSNIIDSLPDGGVTGDIKNALRDFQKNENNELLKDVNIDKAIEIGKGKQNNQKKKPRWVKTTKQED